MRVEFAIAGSLSLTAALLHIAIIFGGEQWYRFFGAGESMASLAANGSWQPALITLGIALVLGLWAAYAFAAAQLLSPLPLMKLALCAIASIYTLRGVAGLILPHVSQHPGITQNSPTFWLVSSVVCMGFAAAHWLGISKYWSTL